MATNIKYLVLVVAISYMIESTQSHNEAGFHCDSVVTAQIQADYVPGIITLDGKSQDWNNIPSYSFPLLPALDPDDDKQYTGGKMTVKALHDGQRIFFLLEVPGEYRYVQGNQTSCPSVSLMFQVGGDATYHSMGACKETVDSCTSKSCGGHEVDIMHFSIGTAIPGRLYGANIFDNINGTGGDRFGNLVDLYAWNPHCRYFDGMGPQGNGNDANFSGQNDWQGAWWHDSIDNSLGLLENASPYGSDGSKGTYTFEFSRPLRTSDRLQQDVQFVIGKTHNFSAAFWYPVNGNPWTKSSHYSVSCDWAPLEIISAEKESHVVSSTRGVDTLNAISLVLSLLAFVVSVFVGWWVRKGKSMTFTPIDHL